MHYTFPRPLPDAAALLASSDRGALCYELQAFIQENIELIDRKLIRDLSYINPLAYYKEGMTIERIENLDANLFRMHFFYQWHIFSGCMDMNEEGVINDKVKFTLSQEGALQFDLNGFGQLSTADDL